MKTERIELAKLKLNEANPRQIREEKFGKLVESLLVFPGMMELRPIVHDTDGTILGGNMRYRALLDIAQMGESAALSRLERVKGWEQRNEAKREAVKSFWGRWFDKPFAYAVKASELTDEEKREFIVKDNAAFGEWDWDMLTSQWDAAELRDWGVDFPKEWARDMGVSENEALNMADVHEDDFSEFTDDIEQRVQPGETWNLGNHIVMCGDSTVLSDVEKLMDGNHADMVFTDPPYGMGKEKDGVRNDNLNRSDLLDFNRKWVAISFSFLKKNGSWYCWGIDQPLMDIYSDILRPMEKGRKITFRNLITWDKGSGQGMNSAGFKMYPIADEKCLFCVVGAATMSSGVFSTKEFFFEGFSSLRDYMVNELKKSGMSIKDVVSLTSTYASHYFAKSQWAFPTEKDYNAIRNACKNSAFQKEYSAFQKEYSELQKEYSELLPYFDNTHDSMTDVWHFERARYTDNDSKTNEYHATPKPIALCSRAIKSSSRNGEIVLDLFGGSGSTLIACEQLGRKCFSMEIDPHYCDVIIARWEKLTGEKAVKIR